MSRQSVLFLLIMSGSAAAQPATFQGLGFLAGGVSDQSYAYGISPGGQYVAGQSSSAAGLQAVVWTIGGSAQGLGILPGRASSKATCVSADGAAAAGYASAGAADEAF